MFLPKTNGALTLYDNFLRPFLSMYQETIDGFISESSKKIGKTINDNIYKQMDLN